MSADVMRFPTGRRAFDRLGLLRPASEAEVVRLDIEIRRIEASMRALSERRRALLAAYRAALHAPTAAQEMQP